VPSVATAQGPPKPYEITWTRAPVAAFSSVTVLLPRFATHHQCAERSQHARLLVILALRRLHASAAGFVHPPVTNFWITAAPQPRSGRCSRAAEWPGRRQAEYPLTALPPRQGGASRRRHPGPPIHLAASHGAPSPTWPNIGPTPLPGPSPWPWVCCTGHQQQGEESSWPPDQGPEPGQPPQYGPVRPRQGDQPSRASVRWRSLLRARGTRFHGCSLMRAAS
jgi:hypothetical protein